MRAGLIDEYVLATHPVLVGGGTPFFTSLDSWVNLNLMETRTFPDGVVPSSYEGLSSIPVRGRGGTPPPAAPAPQRDPFQ
jgi:dihydrofolate reductase